MSKAFDALDYDILASKRIIWGISGLANALFKGYLYVFLNGIESDKEYLTTEVPLYSVLWPLLFLIYINDLQRNSAFYNLFICADYTTLFYNIDSVPEELRHVVLNRELETISYWFIQQLYQKFFSFQTCKSGEVDITLLFVERSPLNWSKSLYGYLLAVDYACLGIYMFPINDFR